MSQSAISGSLALRAALVDLVLSGLFPHRCARKIPFFNAAKPTFYIPGFVGHVAGPGGVHGGPEPLGDCAE